jgi:hypothetical protein
MRKLIAGIVCLFGAAAGHATTLEQLSLDEMIRQSRFIVRGTVSGSWTEQRGAMIYTVYRVAVAEQLKGTAQGSVDVAVPGGLFRGGRQVIPGAPGLTPGVEYVIFVWVSPSGLRQIIGLSQGLFDVRLDPAGERVLVRGPIEADLVDPKGRAVRDAGLRLTWRGLAGEVRRLTQP